MWLLKWALKRCIVCNDEKGHQYLVVIRNDSGTKKFEDDRIRIWTSSLKSIPPFLGWSFVNSQHDALQTNKHSYTVWSPSGLVTKWKEHVNWFLYDVSSVNLLTHWSICTATVSLGCHLQWTLVQCLRRAILISDEGDIKLPATIPFSEY